MRRDVRYERSPLFPAERPSRGLRVLRSIEIGVFGLVRVAVKVADGMDMAARKNEAIFLHGVAGRIIG